MFSISGSPAPPVSEEGTLGPVAAAEIAMEYASLSVGTARIPDIYMTPSSTTLEKWYGVFFVHAGPYAGAVLRLVLTFKHDFPRTAPVLRFESDVFHPLIDPKTKIWHPRGDLLKWQYIKPRVHHVSDLLHDLKSSFELATLDTILESEAVNKQIWKLYHHSHHTFLSMTAQRAISTTSARILYPSETSEMTSATPASPTTPRAAPPRHNRQESITSLTSKASRENLGGRSEGEGYVVFEKLGEAEREGLLKVLKGRPA